MRGYKIFDRYLQCRGFQYHVGKTATISGPIEVCQNGLHFCPRAVDCLRYYDIGNNRFAEVEADECVPKGPSDKYATGALRVVRELSLDEFAKLCTGVMSYTYTDPVDVKGTELHCRVPYRNALKHGVKKTVVAATHARVAFETYVDGILHGRRRTWHPNGKLSSDVMYVDGEMHGTQRLWYSNGKLRGLATFNMGTCTGRLQRWYDCGAYMSDRTYDDHGRVHGDDLEWYRNGELESHKTWVDGHLQGKSHQWWSNGRTRSECVYKDSMKVGHDRAWLSSGQWHKDHRYVNGRLHGLCRSWHENGVLSCRANYHAGNATSLEAWNDKGTLIVT